MKKKSLKIHFLVFEKNGIKGLNLLGNASKTLLPMKSKWFADREFFVR
jgi:hypothetical protein